MLTRISNQNDAVLLTMLNWNNSSHKREYWSFCLALLWGFLNLPGLWIALGLSWKLWTLLYIHILHSGLEGTQESTSQSWTWDLELLILSLIRDWFVNSIWLFEKIKFPQDHYYLLWASLGRNNWIHVKNYNFESWGLDGEASSYKRWIVFNHRIF